MISGFMVEWRSNDIECDVLTHKRSFIHSSVTVVMDDCPRLGYVLTSWCHVSDTCLFSTIDIRSQPWDDLVEASGKSEAHKRLAMILVGHNRPSSMTDEFVLLWECTCTARGMYRQRGGLNGFTICNPELQGASPQCCTWRVNMFTGEGFIDGMVSRMDPETTNLFMQPLKQKDV